jgi:class 3 adenylate cyclase
MTQETEEVRREEKVAVVFDICSSTAILEDLRLTNNEKAWRDLIIALKQFLREKETESSLSSYKFIGDGWILLFPRNYNGTALLKFLQELTALFQYHYEFVLEQLNSPPKISGLTFGVDFGPLIRFEMMERDEYVGRPLNMASRLQSALSKINGNPANKVLFTTPTFSHLRIRESAWVTRRVSVQLRNIRGGEEVKCIEVSLSETPSVPERESNLVRSAYDDLIVRTIFGPYELARPVDTKKLQPLLRRFREVHSQRGRWFVGVRARTRVNQIRGSSIENAYRPAAREMVPQLRTDVWPRRTSSS